MDRLWPTCETMLELPTSTSYSPSLQDTPQQENGFDCGVFTTQFLESVAKGDEGFSFSQKDMLYLRQRMIWEIGRAKLGDDR
jgi:sentrin-specific protease 1